MEAGFWEQAEEDFRKAAELEPENTYAYNNWGCVYKYQEKYEQAMELFKKSIEVMGDKPEHGRQAGDADCLWKYGKLL